MDLVEIRRGNVHVMDKDFSLSEFSLVFKDFVTCIFK